MFTNARWNLFWEGADRPRVGWAAGGRDGGGKPQPMAPVALAVLLRTSVVTGGLSQCGLAPSLSFAPALRLPRSCL